MLKNTLPPEWKSQATRRLCPSPFLGLAAFGDTLVPASSWSQLAEQDLTAKLLDVIPWSCTLGQFDPGCSAFSHAQ